MISKVVFSIFVTILVTSSGFAQTIYGTVPTNELRQADEKFVRFPNWKRMEIVRDGEVNHELSTQVDTSHWDESISINNLKWLQVRELDINVDGIIIAHDYSFAIIPFAVGVRYHKHNSDLVQGTINSLGVIKLTMDTNGEIAYIEILKFDDSQFMERMGRALKIINQYDSSFVIGVLSPILKNYLSQKKNINSLNQFVELYGSQIVSPL